MDSRVKNELKRGLESANQLRVLFAESQANPQQNRELLMACMNHHSSVVLDTFEKAISILKNAQMKDFDGDGVNNSSHPYTILEHRKCYDNRRKSQNQPVKMIKSTAIPEDGYSWRKYGQKPIANTKHPREYYRCGQLGQGCPARKRVQMVSENPTEYGIIYYGHHTCENIPINGYFSQFDIFVDSNENEYANMLSFGSLNGHTNAKEDPYLMEQDQGVIKEEMPSLPHDQNAPSSSSDHHGLISLNPWDQEPVKEDVGLPEWCYSMDSPLFTDEDLKYLMTDGADLDGGFDELRLWDI